MQDYKYSYEVREKLRRFLYNKLSAISQTTEPKKSNWLTLNKELQSGKFQGYKTEWIENPWQNYWKVSLSDDVYIALYLRTNTRKSFDLHLKGVTPRGWYCSEFFFRNIVKAMPNIVAEFEILKAEAEKQEKITNMSQKSILTWLTTTMQNSGYQYYTTNDKNKVLLSVKMMRGVQLDIPIYFTKFQSIMPKLLETIRNYETTIKNNTVKALINNQRKKEIWK